MDITAVIINYQTPELLQTAVTSFKTVYPEVALIIVDNGSKDNSKLLIEDLVRKLPCTTGVYLPENIYHGPAMDKICREAVQTEYVFFLDSDTETMKGGFLEKMLVLFGSDMVYGAGEFTTVNKRGFKAENGITILQTPYMLLKTQIYKTLPPFVHHGQPTLNNFTEAQKQGFDFREFKISEYIEHKWRGTAEKFGYGLGWRGKLDYMLNKIGL